MIAWSYSRYDLHRRCPKAFKYKHLDKLPEPSSEAMARGNSVHKLLEKYVLLRHEGKKPPMLKVKGSNPWDGKLIQPFLSTAVKPDTRSEQQIAFDAKWQLCDWRDWDRCYLRVQVDLSYYPRMNENVTVDYKTGKVKPEEHEEQLTLYALTRMLLEPHLKKVTTGPWYVDHEAEPRLQSVFTGGAKKHVQRLKVYWDRAITPLQRDKKFKATPSPRACRWCPFGKSKGGPCTEEARG